MVWTRLLRLLQFPEKNPPHFSHFFFSLHGNLKSWLFSTYYSLNSSISRKNLPHFPHFFSLHGIFKSWLFSPYYLTSSISRKYLPHFSHFFLITWKLQILTFFTLLFDLFHFTKKTAPLFPFFFDYMTLKQNCLFLTLIAKEKFKFDSARNKLLHRSHFYFGVSKKMLKLKNSHFS